MENLQPEKIASLSSVRSSVLPTQRTEWAERQVEEFLSIPFISEFVYRDVRTTEPRKEEQVADFLIRHRGAGLLIEQKCQENPAARTPQKTELWVRKKAKEGWSQIHRALTRQRDFPVWCNHPRLGRVPFREGLPRIQHGIVTVEVSQRVELDTDAGKLPLEYRGVPITYLSVNDFLNLAVQLRSIPELMDYLTARRSLPQPDLRLVGEEKALFLFYLINDGSFAGCAGLSDARAAVAAEQGRVQAALGRKFEADQYACLLEQVADELANRDPEFSKALPPELLASYDPADRRQNYLEMQAALADLHLRERAELGRAFYATIERISDRDQGFTFRTAQFDSMPEWVYVLGASKNIDRAELLSRIMELMGAAMAFYDKPRCLVIVDRGGDGYEVALSRPGVRPTQAHGLAGRRLFGGLRITSAPLHFLPQH